jgi:hypothetical protein
MEPSEVIQHFGTQQKVADALGLAQSSVAGWVEENRVPIGRQYQIQVLTGGVLQAEPQKKRAAA